VWTMVGGDKIAVGDITDKMLTDGIVAHADLSKLKLGVLPPQCMVGYVAPSQGMSHPCAIAAAIVNDILVSCPLQRSARDCTVRCSDVTCRHNSITFVFYYKDFIISCLDFAASNPFVKELAKHRSSTRSPAQQLKDLRETITKMIQDAPTDEVALHLRVAENGARELAVQQSAGPSASSARGASTLLVQPSAGPSASSARGASTLLVQPSAAPAASSARGASTLLVQPSAAPAASSARGASTLRLQPSAAPSAPSSRVNSIMHGQASAGSLLLGHLSPGCAGSGHVLPGPARASSHSLFVQQPPSSSRLPVCMPILGTSVPCSGARRASSWLQHAGPALPLPPFSLECVPLSSAIPAFPSPSHADWDQPHDMSAPWQPFSSMSVSELESFTAAASISDPVTQHIRTGALTQPGNLLALLQVVNGFFASKCSLSFADMCRPWPGSCSARSWDVAITHAHSRACILTIILAEVSADPDIPSGGCRSGHIWHNDSASSAGFPISAR
jgi:hypothetical protein